MSAARLKLAEVLPAEVRPYLTYSVGVHFAVALLALKVAGLGGGNGKSTVYTIDFVGGPAQITASVAGAAAAPAQEKQAAMPRDSAPPKPTASGEFDEFGRRKGRKNFVLPRPSLLRGAQAPEESRDTTAQRSPINGDAGAAAATGASGPGGDAGVATDMPNFPYPWYITRVRQMLWAKWQSRLGNVSPGAETVVVFSLLPNGSVVDLRTETSSGDSALDIAALAAVQDAAPYPPLPNGFTEPFLKVHVTLKSQ